MVRRILAVLFVLSLSSVVVARSRATAAAEMPRLNPTQWQLLQLLISLEPAELDALMARIEAADADPSVSGTAAVVQRPIDRGDAPTPSGAMDSVLLSSINSVVAKVDGLTTKTNSLLSRVPDRADFRSLGSEGRVAEIRAVINNVHDVLDGVLALIREQKVGYDEFVGGPSGSCAPGSPCATFKADLSRQFDDIEDGWLTFQKLRCLDRPDVVIVPLQTQLFRTLITDRAPLVVLHFLKRVLDQSEGWQTRLREMIDEIPVELTQFCDDGSGSSPAATPRRKATLSTPTSPLLGDTCLDSPNGACCALRPEFRGRALRRAKGLADSAEMAFKIAGAWIADDKDVTVGADVVAGAAGGTNVENPTDAVLSTLEAIAAKLSNVLDGLVDRRKDCTDADAEREHDLQACTALVPYVLPQGEGGGVWDELDELVDLRIVELEATGRDATEARGFLESARLSPGTRSGFDSLCDAYQSATGRNATEGRRGLR